MLAIARALFLPPPSPDVCSDDTAVDGPNAAAKLSGSGSAPVPAVTVGLAVPHAAHLRFIDVLCRVHLVQAQPGPGPRCLGRLVESEAADDPAAPLLAGEGEGAPLVADDLCLFLLVVMADADPAAVGSL